MFKNYIILFTNRGQDTEVTFIRGGHRPGSQTPNGSTSPAHSSPRRGSENGFPSAQSFQLNLNGIDNSSSRTSSSRSSQASEPDLSNTDIFMKELLAGGVSQLAGTESRESSPSVETFQGSPHSQISPPALSDSQPAVLQPMTHPMQAVLNHTGMPSSHPHLVNGFSYQAPTTIPQRVFNGFQPAMSSTPTTVDSVPNGFPVNTLQQYGPWSSSPPYVSGALGSHPHVNPPGSFVGNGKLQTICSYVEDNIVNL